MPGYDPVLVRWLNDELRVPRHVDSLESDLSNGFVFGAVLKHLALKARSAADHPFHGLDDLILATVPNLKDEQDTLTKVTNWRSLQSLLPEGIRVSDADIEAIATERRGAAAKLILQLKSLDDVATGKMQAPYSSRKPRSKSPVRRGDMSGSIGGVSARLAAATAGGSRTLQYVQKLMDTGMSTKQIGIEGQLAKFATTSTSGFGAKSTNLRDTTTDRTAHKHTAASPIRYHHALDKSAGATNNVGEEILKRDLAFELTMAERRALSRQHITAQHDREGKEGVLDFEGRMRRQGLDPTGPSADRITATANTTASHAMTTNTLDTGDRRGTHRIGHPPDARTVAPAPPVSSAQLAIQRAFPQDASVLSAMQPDTYIADITQKFAQSFRPKAVDEYADKIHASVAAAQASRRDKLTRDRLAASSQAASQTAVHQRAEDLAAVQDYLQEAKAQEGRAADVYFESRNAKVAQQQFLSTLAAEEARRSAAAAAFLDAERSRLESEKDTRPQEMRLMQRATIEKQRHDLNHQIVGDTVDKLLTLVEHVALLRRESEQSGGTVLLLPEQWRQVRQCFVSGRLPVAAIADSPLQHDILTDNRENKPVSEVASILQRMLPTLQTLQGLQVWKSATVSAESTLSSGGSLIPPAADFDILRGVFDEMDAEDLMHGVGVWPDSGSCDLDVSSLFEDEESRAPSSPLEAIIDSERAAAAVHAIAHEVEAAENLREDLMDGSETAKRIVSHFIGTPLALSRPLRVCMHTTSSARGDSADVSLAGSLRLAARLRMLHITAHDVLYVACSYFSSCLKEIQDAAKKTSPGGDVAGDLQQAVDKVFAKTAALHKFAPTMKCKLSDVGLRPLDDMLQFRGAEEEAFFECGASFLGMAVAAHKTAASMLASGKVIEPDMDGLSSRSELGVTKDQRDKIMRPVSVLDGEGFLQHVRSLRDLAAEALRAADGAGKQAKGKKDATSGKPASKSSDKEKSGKDKAAAVAAGATDKLLFNRTELELQADEIGSIVDKMSGHRYFLVALASYLRKSWVNCQNLSATSAPGGLMLHSIPSSGGQLLSCEYAFNGPVLFSQRFADMPSPRGPSPDIGSPIPAAEAIRQPSAYAPENWDGSLSSLLDLYDAGSWRLPRVGPEAMAEWQQLCKNNGMSAADIDHLLAQYSKIEGPVIANPEPSLSGVPGNRKSSASVTKPSSKDAPAAFNAPPPPLLYSCIHAAISFGIDEAPEDSFSTLAQDVFSGELCSVPSKLAALQDGAESESSSRRASIVASGKPGNSKDAGAALKKAVKEVSPRSEETLAIGTMVSTITSLSRRMLQPVPRAAEPAWTAPRCLENMIDLCKHTAQFAHITCKVPSLGGTAVLAFGGVEMALEQLVEDEEGQPIRGTPSSEVPLQESFEKYVLHAMAGGAVIAVDDLQSLQRAYQANLRSFRTAISSVMKTIKSAQLLHRSKLRQGARSILRVLRGQNQLPGAAAVMKIDSVESVLRRHRDLSPGGAPVFYQTPTGITSSEFARLYHALRAAFSASPSLSNSLALSFCQQAEDSAASLWKQAEQIRDAAHAKLLELQSETSQSLCAHILEKCFQDAAFALLRHFEDAVTMLSAVDIGVRGNLENDVRAMTEAVKVTARHSKEETRNASTTQGISSERLQEYVDRVIATARTTFSADTRDSTVVGTCLAYLSNQLHALIPTLEACDAKVSKGVLKRALHTIVQLSALARTLNNARIWIEASKLATVGACKSYVKNWLVARDAALFGVTDNMKSKIMAFTPTGSMSLSMPKSMDGLLKVADRKDALPSVAQLHPSSFEIPMNDGIAEAFGSLQTADKLQSIPLEAIGERVQDGQAVLEQLIADTCTPGDADPADEQPSAFVTVLANHDACFHHWRLPAACISSIVAVLKGPSSGVSRVPSRRPSRQSSPSGSPQRRNSITSSEEVGLLGDASNVLKQALRSVVTGVPFATSGRRQSTVAVAGPGWASVPSAVCRSLTHNCCIPARFQEAPVSWDRLAVRKLAITLVLQRLRYPPVLEQLFLFLSNLLGSDGDNDGFVTRREFDTTVAFFETTPERARTVLERNASMAGPVPETVKAASRRTSLSGALVPEAAMAQGAERDTDSALQQALVAGTAAGRLQESLALRSLFWDLYSDGHRLNYGDLLLDLCIDPRWAYPIAVPSPTAVVDGRAHAATAVGGRVSSVDGTVGTPSGHTFFAAAADMPISCFLAHSHPVKVQTPAGTYRGMGVVKALLVAEALSRRDLKEIGVLWLEIQHSRLMKDTLLSAPAINAVLSHVSVAQEMGASTVYDLLCGLSEEQLHLVGHFEATNLQLLLPPP